MNAMSTESRTYELKARAAAQEETRRRIVEATVDLHEEVGPAKTTVAEIARRAGVQRLTVYNHFPEDRDLFAACGAHWLAGHPPPDVAALMEIANPAERLRAILTRFYMYYRANERMRANIERDRLVLPALDEVVNAGMGRGSARLISSIAAAHGLGQRPEKTLRAALTLALDFWTWSCLARAGLSDPQAAGMMVAAVEGILQS
jgi:AcrR family transcriptional regulator